MKKNWYYLFLSMAIMAMPLTSCSNDDDEPKPNEEQLYDKESKEEVKPVTAFNALSWLQKCLVIVDENNNVIRRIYGKPLDASQPTVISVPVADYAVAENIFLGWVAPGKEATKVEGGYDYTLTDKEGKTQGGVSFSAVEGEDGVFARMTVAPGTDLKQVTEVQFIDADLWPENDAYLRVESRKIYYLEDYEFYWTDGGGYDKIFHVEKKRLPFYCLQGNTTGREGILVYLSPDDYNYFSHPIMKWYKRDALPYLPSEAFAQKVVDKINENEAHWTTMLSDMKFNGYDWYAKPFDLRDDAAAKSKFVIGELDEGLILDDIMCFEMDSYPAELEWIFESSMQMYRYMQIQIIPPVKK